MTTLLTSHRVLTCLHAAHGARQRVGSGPGAGAQGECGSGALLCAVTPAQLHAHDTTMVERGRCSPLLPPLMQVRYEGRSASTPASIAHTLGSYPGPVALVCIQVRDRGYAIGMRWDGWLVQVRSVL